MFGNFWKKSTINPQKLEEVKAWVRISLTLTEDDVIMISELRCSDPGCPDIETLIAIMKPGLPVARYRMLKPVQDLTQEMIHTVLTRA